MIKDEEIDISQLRIEGAELLAKIHCASFKGLPEQIWSTNDFHELFEIPGTIAYAINKDDHPIGFVMIREIIDEVEIITFCILPKWCNNGYASLLLEWLIRKLQLRSFKRLFLEVREDNGAAVKLYNKCSFKVIGRRTGYYNGNIDALVMQTDLID